MIRFANPGSDIDGFTRIFQALVEALEDHQPFSLDDMSKALVSKGLATSSGYMGEEALERSTRDDRSRDPLYNQSKMYSELFRLLGWIHPTAESRLTFRITWLGLHVREAGGGAKKLVAESVLGIAFPNDTVEAKGDYRLRPFATILRSMAHLDDIICRDEMIIGPLCLEDDTNTRGFNVMVAGVRAVRGNARRLESALDKIAADRGIQRNTMMNYTRFPLAVLKWSGWTSKERDSGPYGRPVVFHQLTPLGREQVAWINSTVDLRAAQVTQQNSALQEVICKRAVIGMLHRSGFDTDGLRSQVAQWSEAMVTGRVIASASADVLFSPFQEMPPTFADGLFRSSPVPATGEAGQGAARAASAGRGGGRAAAAIALVRLRTGGGRGAAIPSDGAAASKLIAEIAAKYPGRPNEAVDAIMKRFENSTKTEFYPFVAGLFCCLGYDCTASRVGVNYQRWDAIIRHATESVAIEIKSPAEERSVSVKAVRQALENKIILVARRSYPTTMSASSFVVGYDPPNDRAEVGGLVADIHRAFGISIGVIDLRALVMLAVSVVIEGKTHDSDAFLKLRGLIDVINA